MNTRRTFLKTSAAALAVTAAHPLLGWQGSNNRIRMAVVGCGNRAGRVFDSFVRSGGADCQFVAAAEVNPLARVGPRGPQEQSTVAGRIIEDCRLQIEDSRIDDCRTPIGAVL